MAKRRRMMTDVEIALVKAMIKRGMKNDKIHYYFNRPDRLISSGRIAQIKKNQYGAAISEAPSSALEQFLEEWEAKQHSARAQQPASPVDSTHVREMFREFDGIWKLSIGETDTTECKKSFRVAPEQRFAVVIRSIAGLANNRGGYIFFGIDDDNDCILGLAADDNFANTDPAEINRVIASALDPVPRISTALVEFGDKYLGVLHVEKHEHAPIVALKNIGSEVREGAIYFRYVGETCAIKPGELRQIIARREQQAVAEFANRMNRVATGNDATINLETGEVSGKSGGFVIDRKLLPSIQFIREGDFSEVKGAPALRLIGEVEPVDADERRRAKVIRQNVTADSVIRNFLRGEKVADPMQYIHFQAHTPRRWLPVWYYVKQSGLHVDDVVNDLRKEVATNPISRDAVVQRLLRKTTAFRAPSGKAVHVRNLLVKGQELSPSTTQLDMQFANAVQGLPADYAEPARLLPVLLGSVDRALGTDDKSGSRRSAIYRAACRLDELLYA